MGSLFCSSLSPVRVNYHINLLTAFLWLLLTALAGMTLGRWQKQPWMTVGCPILCVIAFLVEINIWIMHP